MERLRAPARGPAGASWIGVVTVTLGLLGLAGPATGLAAQEADQARFDLTGVVVDPAGRPLVGAFVAVGHDEWGSLTGDAGRFVLPDLQAGEVTLRVELLGYETLRWTGFVAAGVPLTLTLETEPIVLEGLNVVTDRFESRRRGVATAVRWYDYKALATSTHVNTLDFLTQRAGLARIPCRGAWSSDCVLVRGRVTEPSVWIDENPVLGGMDYLRAVPPNELYMVEVYASGRHIRAYTQRFMERAARTRLMPMPVF